MRVPLPLFCRTTLAALSLSLLTPLASAASRNPADYPLRVHIYRMQRHTRYFRGTVDWVEGEGRANLFENGQPEGIDFDYDCGERFMNSSGYETYFARWKKPGRSLVLLMREIGSNSTDTCELKVDVKNFAYYTRNGVLYTEPIPAFKAWMTKHQYDPEHGMNEPVFDQNPQREQAPHPGPQTPAEPGPQ